MLINTIKNSNYFINEINLNIITNSSLTLIGLIYFISFG